ncbi:MAG TPA: peptide-N-glycosidase F-related protein, partial [Chitinophagaceae bacterium]|nr:peptide-N-glycosidase F-related protein [Chitinophagaceae bacterium]
TPFNWDGVSNVLIDFSFTNSTPGNPLQITSSAAVNMGMYAANGFYLNTAGGVVTSLPAASLSPIHNEITVGFWSRGNAGISTQNTSIIEGVDNGNRRQLNIHLPWSNSNVYFDCGNLGSGYDRINKAATVAELQGNWNYWTFTKNAVSGIMNIYLNGMLWHTGSAKTNTIQIDSLLFGANITSGNPFKGDVDELSIWDKELNAGTITAWMNKAIDATHPDYAHLLAYYKLDEGSGLLIQDSSVSNQQAQFPFSPSWHFTRGNELSRLFQPLSARPDITFLKGTYTLTNTNILAYDSVQAEPNIVKAYAVVPHPGTIQSDEVTVVSTNLYWLATYRYVYNGLSGALIDSLPVSAIDTIHILNLSYIDRFPMKFEIMSFVTPYGINLDLGMNGKTWTFDMTDFLPVLKGNKRITVERGGEWQENMDIKFLFIVGTPPHDVLDIKNIWRQPGNCNYNDIVTDKYFEPRNVPLLNTGKSFKIRTMITGHGQEGEFIPRMHALNVNGGANEFEWQVYKKCAFNPVYPQGGTWIYDRCGWCPGMASDLKESDITSYVTPGVPADIDYTMLPDTGIGTSNYLVTNQLVTYGAMHFTNDAAVTDVMAPTNKIEYARSQAICNHPKIMIQNTGSAPLTTLTIEYWINANTTRSVYQWQGNLLPMQKEEVELPAFDLWVNVNSPDNVFHVELKNPNGAGDEYSFNNFFHSAFKITDVVPSDFIIYHRTNSAASETSYALYDVWDNLLFSRTGLTNLTTYRDTFHLAQGCYKFVMTDTDEDGISFWANSDGAGQVRFQRSNGTTLKTFNPDFGGSIIYNFTIDFPLSFESLEEAQWQVYPNPATDYLMVEFPDQGIEQYEVRNVLGQMQTVKAEKTAAGLKLDISQLPSGLYILKADIHGTPRTRKFRVQ